MIGDGHSRAIQVPFTTALMTNSRTSNTTSTDQHLLHQTFLPTFTNLTSKDLLDILFLYILLSLDLNQAPFVHRLQCCPPPDCGISVPQRNRKSLRKRHDRLEFDTPHPLPFDSLLSLLSEPPEVPKRSRNRYGLAIALDWPFRPVQDGPFVCSSALVGHIIS